MRRLTVLVIGIIIFVSFVDNKSQLPVIAPYAASIGATPTIVGIIVAIYSVSNLIGNLVAGYLLDYAGRKRLLIVGLTAVGLAVLLYSAARSPMQLMAIRAAHGLAGAILAPAAFTLLGDLFPRAQRGQVMGISGAIIALAAIFAPAMSGVIRDRLGFSAVFVTVAVLMLGTAVLSQLFVAETHRPSERRALNRETFILLLRRPALLQAYVAAVVLHFGMGSLVTQLPIHMGESGYSGSQTGFAFSAFAILALIAMLGLAGRIGVANRGAPIGAGLVLVGLGLLLLPMRSQLTIILAAMGLYGLGFGLVFPAANALVADATQPHDRGTAFGLFYAFYSIGVILGASSAGLVADGRWLPGLDPFLPAALLALASGPVVFLARRTGSESASFQP